MTMPGNSRSLWTTCTPISIETFEDIKVLSVERFDRKYSEDNTWIIRLPQEDMCQANGFAPALKYESDGGPGISSIMKLLSASSRPEKDRKQFMKSVFLFWLLGAIDGHAKNFSIFLMQGGRFHLTPIYDVISAYPLVEKRQLEQRKMRVAMALHGKNTHYAYHEIMPRHWFDEAKKVGFPDAEMQFIINETVNHIGSVIETVSSRLPPEIPERVVDAIFSSMKTAINKFELPP